MTKVFQKENFGRKINQFIFQKENYTYMEIKLNGSMVAIINTSSRYFGSCFVIWRDGSPIGCEKTFKKAFERVSRANKTQHISEVLDEITRQLKEQS